MITTVDRVLVPPVLEVSQLGKSFAGNPVLADVSFTLEAGRVMVVRGANGTGKSTLLRCIVGDERPDSGRVLFRGEPLTAADRSTRAAIAVDLGASDHLPYLTVREHLEFIARAHGDSRPEQLVSLVLEDLRLAAAQDRSPATLSQGQRRRLRLAACLVRPRALMVLDEPEQNLDTAGRQWLVGMIRAEREAGGAVLMVSHESWISDEVADAELLLTFHEPVDAGIDDRPGRQQ